MGKDGGEIRNEVAGKTIALVRRGGVYLMPMHIDGSGARVFPRPGK